MSTVKEIEAPALPDWLAPALPWRRRMFEIRGYKVHTIDEGEGPAVFLQHGNPTWCFLWRKVIQRLVGKNLRLVAPDLVGFGLSDKPRSPSAHSLTMHADILADLATALDLKKIVIVGQDWGGPTATAMAVRLPERIHGLVYGNTSVLHPNPPGRVKPFHKFSHFPVLSDLFFRGLNFPIPVLHKVQGDPASIGPFEKRAYAWPFPNWASRAGGMALARMVPNHPGHPTLPEMVRMDAFVKAFKGPAALVWGLRDPILGRLLPRHQRALPHATVTETQAGHFLQEEVPDELAAAILRVAQG